jgi:hypothetical protein
MKGKRKTKRKIKTKREWNMGEKKEKDRKREGQINLGKN